MNANEIRQTFIDFYQSKDHKFVKSAPLVPHDDPTLLFTSAGMVQFKDFYAGTQELPYTRAVTVQKCLRVTDIDEVGRTPRHDTFFEMLGHFSFGDYFKREAIHWNWELFTQIYGIDAARLTASVFTDDDEAYDVWRHEIGLPEERVVRLGAGDNFWGPAGGTGACGPCSELYYDLGPEVDRGRPDAKPGDDCNRFVEVGNFVFPQFDRQSDGHDRPLKNRGIDTGIGLERLAMVLQGKTSIFHTDLFWPLIQQAAEVCDQPYEGNEIALHIIADHVRALTFALGEGVLPANEGRGYVIRRLIRRAYVQGHTLGITEPFLCKLVDPVVEMMRGPYPEVAEGRERAILALENEEERFRGTLEQGLGRLQTILGRAEQDASRTVPGEEAFVLYDTYGLPLDVIRDMAHAQDLRVDEEGFERRMAEQKERSRAAATFGRDTAGLEWTLVSEGEHSKFRGHETLDVAGCRVRRLARVPEARDRIVVILDSTPFYGESGGQTGDTGELRSNDVRLEVVDTLRAGVEVRHIVAAAASVTALLADAERTWQARVDAERRDAICQHHTATHLLQASLRRVLGAHVAQAGSLVAPERLRFDFTHFSALSGAEKEEVERIANGMIQANAPVEVRFSTYDDAIREGVTALFGEKYDAESVRRVRIPGFSEELCGGTHVAATGQIGALVILEESAVAAGTRRIEAVCGQAAIGQVQRLRQRLTDARRMLGASADEVTGKIEALMREVSSLRKGLAKARRGEGVSHLDTLLSSAEEVGDHRFLVGSVQAGSVDELRELGDRVRQRLGSGGAVLCAEIGPKTSFLAVITDDLAKDKKIRADELVRAVAGVTGGGGGGRPHMALGGAADSARVPEALEEARRLLRAALEQAGP